MGPFRFNGPRAVYTRLCLGLGALAALTSGTLAWARPFTVDDLLHLEGLRGAAVDPTGRWAVIERLAPYVEAGRFDEDDYTDVLRRSLLRVDLKHGGQVAPLLTSTPGVGYALGPIAPDGGHAVVYRLAGRRWRLGLATLATRQVRWFALTPEISGYGRTAQWLSSRSLAIILRPLDDPPRLVGIGWRAQTRLDALWRRSALGRQAGVTALGSGAYRDIRPKAAPNRLVQLEVSTGAVRELARGDLYDLEASPSGRYLAALADGVDLQPAAQDEARVGASGRGRDLVLVDLQTGRSRRPCAGRDVLSHLLSWSPDGEDLLVFTRAMGAPWERGRLERVSARSGGARPLAMMGVRPEVSYTGLGMPLVSADWLGADPLVRGRREGEAGVRADWFALRASGAVVLTKDLPTPPPPQLAAVDRAGLFLVSEGSLWFADATGRARKLLSAPDLSAVARSDLGLGDRFHWNNAPRRNWVLVQDARAGVIERVGRTAVAWRTATSSGTHLLAVDPAAGAVLSSTAASQGVQAVQLSQAKTTTTLFEFNRQLAGIEFARQRQVDYRSTEGQALTGWLYLPPQPPPPKGWPVVVIPYPGQIYATPPAIQAPGVFTPVTSAQVLAGRGYAVLTPSLPIHAGEDPTASFGPDVAAALQAAAATGSVDVSRAAVWGHSFGGYTALVLAARSAQFKAVIESAGVSDLVSARGVFMPFFRLNPEYGLPIETSAGWVESGQAGMGRPPWEVPQRYIQSSPVFMADKITAPVLMLQGDLDNTSLGQAEEMFSALYRQDKTAELASYWGEGHILRSPGNIRDLYQRVFDWLDRWVGPSGRQVAVTPAGQGGPTDAPTPEPRPRS